MFRKSEVVTSLGSAAFLKKSGKKAGKKSRKKVGKKNGKKVDKKGGKKVETEKLSAKFEWHLLGSVVRFSISDPVMLLKGIKKNLVLSNELIKVELPP